MSFGENLRHIRNKKQISQKQLAHLLNTSQQHISQLETNLREPNLEDIKQLSSIFELPTDLLIQDSFLEYSTKSLDAELWLLLNQLSYNSKTLIRDLLILLTHNS